MATTSTSNPILNRHNEMATEEDARNCYRHRLTDQRGLPIAQKCFGSKFSFEDEKISYHYENFRITNASKTHVVVVWLTLLVLFIYGFVVSFTAYSNDLWVMRVLLTLRLLISLVAVFNYYTIFYAAVPSDASQKLFRSYVSSVTNMSNFIIISIAVVNGIVYVWQSSLGSCMAVNKDTNIVELNHQDKYFYDCNPSYEIGGTPTNSMVLLLVGNIFVVITLRCHSCWAARISYYITCVSAIAASVLAPDFGQSSLIIFSALLTVIIYECVEDNSLAMFTALLRLESTNRIQTSELKHFIGNVAHDLKVSYQQTINYFSVF
jgi:hypothetical protein